MEQRHWGFVGAILSGMNVTVSVTWQSMWMVKPTSAPLLQEIALKILFGVRLSLILVLGWMTLML